MNLGIIINGLLPANVLYYQQLVLLKSATRKMIITSPQKFSIITCRHVFDHRYHKNTYIFTADEPNETIADYLIPENIVILFIL